MIRRLGSAFLAASSRTQVLSLLSGFIAVRVLLSLKHGMTPEGDGLAAGIEMGRFWLGQIPFSELVHPNSYAGVFLRHRSTQLLFPLLVSLQPIIGWDVRTHLLILNTMLGAILLVASYAVACRLQGKSYAVLVSLLMCSLTPLYWIARFGLVDNVFYAAIPVFALSVIAWLRDKTVKNVTLLILATGAFLLTRPESAFAVGLAVLILAWTFLAERWSRRVATLSLLLVCSTAALGAIVAVASSPSLQKRILSTGNVSVALVWSAESLFNRGQEGSGASEFDLVFKKYESVGTIDPLKPFDYEQLSYERSMAAIAVIKARPFWFVFKMPLRALALMFPWTYQPWSLPHKLFEAVYTLFLMGGLVLAIRRGTFDVPSLVVLAIPLGILCLLSMTGIDNDLKHRNGVLIGLNLIAPLGYFLKSANRDAAPRPESVRTAG